MSKDAAIAAALAPLNKVAAGIKLCIAIQKQYVEPAIKACIGLITGLASEYACMNVKRLVRCVHFEFQKYKTCEE